MNGGGSRPSVNRTRKQMNLVQYTQRCWCVCTQLAHDGRRQRRNSARVAPICDNGCTQQPRHTGRVRLGGCCAARVCCCSAETTGSGSRRQHNNATTSFHGWVTTSLGRPEQPRLTRAARQNTTRSAQGHFGWHYVAVRYCFRPPARCSLPLSCMACAAFP